MIEISCFLRESDILIPIHDMRRYDGSLDYIEGVLHLVVDGVELISREQWDLVDQLWAYLLEGLRIVVHEHGGFRCSFPDQPLPVEMRYVVPGRIHLRVGERAVETDLEAFATAFLAGAERFCDELERLVGEYEVEPLRAQLERVRAAPAPSQPTRG